MVIETHQVLSVVQLDVEETRQTVAYSRDDLVGVDKLFRECDGVFVVRKIDHGTVATDVKDGIKVLGLPKELADRLRRLPHSFLVLVEVGAYRVGLERLDTSGTDGGFAALRGNDSDVDTSLLEDMVWVSKLRLELNVSKA